MYAVIEDSGTQIKVSEGDVIKVDVRELPADAATLTFDKVMLIATPADDEGNGGSQSIGKPYVSGASVEVDILEEGRDDKIHIWKKKRRKGYVRHKGHRQSYLKVKVTKISA